MNRRLKGKIVEKVCRYSREFYIKAKSGVKGVGSKKGEYREETVYASLIQSVNLNVNIKCKLKM